MKNSSKGQNKLGKVEEKRIFKCYQVLGITLKLPKISQSYSVWQNLGPYEGELFYFEAIENYSSMKNKWIHNKVF